MAKYEEPFEETQDFYNAAITAAGLDNKVNITILADNKAKDIFKVNKANELLRFRTGDDIILVINEKMFDQLTDEQRLIVVEESIAAIVYDDEKDKLIINKPDVNTFSGILSKHTFEVWDVLRESIKSLYNAEKEEEQKRKDATAKAKGKKTY